MHCCLSQANGKPVPIPVRTRILPADNFISGDVPRLYFSRYYAVIIAKTISTQHIRDIVALYLPLVYRKPIGRGVEVQVRL